MCDSEKHGILYVASGPIIKNVVFEDNVYVVVESWGSEANDGHQREYLNVGPIITSYAPAVKLLYVVIEKLLV